MKKFVVKSFINMLGIYIASLIFPTITVASLEAVFWVGIVLGLINLLIRPILLLISLPINLITLGLFTMVINACLVMLTTHLASGVHIPSFFLSFATAFVISILSIIADHLLY